MSRLDNRVTLVKWFNNWRTRTKCNCFFVRYETKTFIHCCYCCQRIAYWVLSVGHYHASLPKAVFNKLIDQSIMHQEALARCRTDHSSNVLTNPFSGRIQFPIQVCFSALLPGFLALLSLSDWNNILGLLKYLCAFLFRPGIDRIFVRLSRKSFRIYCVRYSIVFKFSRNNTVKRNQLSTTINWFIIALTAL